LTEFFPKSRTYWGKNEEKKHPINSEGNSEKMSGEDEGRQQSGGVRTLDGSGEKVQFTNGAEPEIQDWGLKKRGDSLRAPGLRDSIGI